MRAADSPSFLFDGPEAARNTIVLAHGAGAAMDSAFMNTIAAGLADRDLRIARFEFPYMQKRRADGGPPPARSSADPARVLAPGDRGVGTGEPPNHRWQVDGGTHGEPDRR